MNPYNYLRKIAKGVKFQNLFTASKDLENIKIFRNETDFSSLQEHFLSLLYHYENIQQDIIMYGLNKNIVDNDYYCECYMLWKNKKGYKQIDNIDSTKEVSLVAGNKIIFPKG